jgi:hypothetical protein
MSGYEEVAGSKASSNKCTMWFTYQNLRLIELYASERVDGWNLLWYLGAPRSKGRRLLLPPALETPPSTYFSFLQSYVAIYLYFSRYTPWFRRCIRKKLLGVCFQVPSQTDYFDGQPELRRLHKP